MTATEVFGGSTASWLWGAFAASVAALLGIDMFWLARRRRVREAAGHSAMGDAVAFSLLVVGLAGCFALGLAVTGGRERALAFVAGFLVEEALSVDNLFVFLLIFARFGVPAADQQRVLFWGIFGALVLRAACIAAGTALVAHVSWIFYVFGALLVLAAAKLLRPGPSEGEGDDEAEGGATEGRLARAFRRLVPMTPRLVGSRFFVREGGRWLATPLLWVLFLIEGSDIVFALDSIPAVFAMTSDPFVIYTSNIFAILGLRSLYALLAGMMKRFVYLKTGLGVVLLFIGGKMLLAHVVEVPVGVSLGVIVVVLGVSIGASFGRSGPKSEP